ncbi:Alpha/beta hydrolase fold-1 [Xylariomycetidae sp. FL0641]|nr:Alpha/beta hydrolase fold-1 [Xylariomycetidae sp. FL0641]
MANSGKPALVFVPGAWCDAGYFSRTTEILERAGLTCEAVSLPSVGSELHSDGPSASEATLYKDAEAVKKVVMKHLDVGKDVVVIAHSYGGVVASEAMKGLDRGSRGGSQAAVVHMVYVAALVFDIGVMTWAPDDSKFAESLIIQGGLCWRNPYDASNAPAVSKCSPEQLAFLASFLRSHAWRSFRDPVTHTAWRVIPTTYVRAKHDMMPDQLASPPEGHKFAEVLEIDSDHFAFVCAAQEVAGIVQRVAEKVSLDKA